MLKLAMPLYEVKYHEEDEWKEISEFDLMDDLYKTHMKVTPEIKKMIIGKEVETPYGIYRLKLKGRVQGVEKSELFAADDFYDYYLSTPFNNKCRGMQKL